MFLRLLGTVVIVLPLTGCFTLFGYEDETVNEEQQVVESTSFAVLDLGAPGEDAFNAGARTATQAFRTATVERDRLQTQIAEDEADLAITTPFRELQRKLTEGLGTSINVGWANIVDKDMKAADAEFTKLENGQSNTFANFNSILEGWVFKMEAGELLLPPPVTAPPTPIIPN